jgi:hypothetical protein
MKNFKGIIKRLAGILGAFIVLCLGAITWWRLWVYKGFIGPLPILHWLIKSDGEFSYTLTEYEIFIHLLVSMALIYSVIKYFTKPASGASR